MLWDNAMAQCYGVMLWDDTIGQFCGVLLWGDTPVVVWGSAVGWHLWGDVKGQH